MIIKKPYAFIVRHYKLLHLLMLLPMIYLIYKTYRIFGFFRDFVAAGYKTSLVDVAHTYAGGFIPLACLLIIVVALFILSLRKNKHLGYKHYLALILFYLALFIVSLFIGGILNSFEVDTIESSVALTNRGIASVLLYIQPVWIIVVLLMMFNFDLKTLSFNDIKDEISLDESDSEEIEVASSVEDYKIKRGIRRYLRELKYYVIENKNVFKVIVLILGVILAIFLITFIVSLNKVVRIDQNFSHSNFNVSFNKAILSTLDYNGNVISNNNIYLAIKTTVKNKSKKVIPLDTNAFELELDDVNYYPVLDRSGKFLDLAKPYYGENIGPDSSQEYVLVYEIPNKYINSRFKIRILDSVTTKKERLIAKYKEIVLNPEVSTSISNKGTININDTLDLSKTTLDKTTLTINDYSQEESYVYNYEYCYGIDKCMDSKNSVSSSANKTLLVLDANLAIDSNTPYSKYKLNINNFYDDFVKVEATKNNQTAIYGVKDVTPSKVTDKVILEVSKEIVNSTNLNLLVTIRNNQYRIKLA